MKFFALIGLLFAGSAMLWGIFKMFHTFVRGMEKDVTEKQGDIE